MGDDSEDAERGVSVPFPHTLDEKNRNTTDVVAIDYYPFVSRSITFRYRTF